VATAIWAEVQKSCIKAARLVTPENCAGHFRKFVLLDINDPALKLIEEPSSPTVSHTGA
jgi:hypothetical protein